MPSRSDSWVDAVRPIGVDNPLVCIDRLRQEPLPLSPPTLTSRSPMCCNLYNYLSQFLLSYLSQSNLETERNSRMSRVSFLCKEEGTAWPWTSRRSSTA